MDACGGCLRPHLARWANLSHFLLSDSMGRIGNDDYLVSSLQCLVRRKKLISKCLVEGDVNEQKSIRGND